MAHRPRLLAVAEIEAFSASGLWAILGMLAFGTTAVMIAGGDVTLAHDGHGDAVALPVAGQ